MPLRLLVTLLLLILAACVGASLPSLTPAITGSVDIVYPQTGSVIYADQLYAAGTGSNVPVDVFALQLVGPDGTIMGRYPVQTGAGEWQVELTHGYTGEPIEVTVSAVPESGSVPAEVAYDVATIVLAGQSYRPDGIFGSITIPAEGSVVGGDSFEVSGTVSSVFESTFVLSLLDPTGAVIDSKPITVFDFYYLDEVPWTAELATNGYTGPAEIRAFYLAPRDGSEEELAGILVTVGQEAG